jgi:VWFA-related protein
VLALVLTATAVAQQTPSPFPPQAQPTSIKTTAEEVILDVVVRDKKGKQVRDLGPADFEVTDNGVKQTIRSVRLVEGREAISKGTGAGGAKSTPAALDPLRQIRLVTMVFERLSTEQRQFARNAALDLLKGSQAKNVFYAVMTIDQRLSVLQQFTGDHDALIKAVEKATSGAYTEFGADSDRITEQLTKMLGQPPDGLTVNEKIAAGTTNLPAQAAPTGDNINAMMAQVMLNMVQLNQGMATSEAARMSISALLSMVRGQATLPGRKTILYFTQGLQVPTSLDGFFHTLISTANRNGVAFYAIDARGLSGESEIGRAAEQLRASASGSRRTTTSTGGQAVTRDEVTSGDRADESFKANTLAELRNLSESTGGFLIANTNDLRPALTKVNEEINAYYEIAYSPNIEAYDGRFRKTTVRLLGSDARVQTRTGYFALPAKESGLGLQPFEVPLLKALGTSPLPKDVTFRAAAVRLQQKKDAFQAALAVEVPLKSLTFTEDKQGNTYTARVSLVALVKNAQGEVVKRFDKDVPIHGPLAQLAGVREANFLYKDQFSGPPGRYTIETAVMDGEGNKIGARRAVFTAGSRANGVDVSNILVVRRFEPSVKDLDPAEPFELRGGRVTPALSAAVPGGKGSQLSLYFVIHPDPTISAMPEAIIEYLQDGKVLGSGTVPVSPPDAKGRIACVMSSSAEQMPPGNYEARVVVKQGNTAAEERVTVTIEGPPGQ